MRPEFYKVLQSPILWGVLLLAALLPFVLPSYYLHIVILSLVYVALASSWNIVGGMAGQISLAHSLFIGIGAMLSTALLLKLGINMWLGLLISAAISAVMAAMIAWIDYRFRLGHLSFVLITLAFAEMGGALLTSGAQKQESAVSVRHEAVEGTSRQLWRAVAADKSAVSLAARVEVARGAQQTDGEQSLRGLLLQRTATVNLKPELEIFADDVKCAHGATVGELDKRALFYLQSRGIDEGRAKALLTRAFVADAMARIGEEPVRTAFESEADAWLEAAL